MYWAALDPKVEQLTASHSQGLVYWIGLRGARLQDCERLLSLALETCPDPDTVVVHLGGNDIGINSLRFCLRLIRHLPQLVAQYAPQAVLYWSDVLPRVAYRGIERVPAEKTRIRMNMCARSFRFVIGIKHPSLKSETKENFRADGVHLTERGNAIFISTLLEYTEVRGPADLTRGPLYRHVKCADVKGDGQQWLDQLKSVGVYVCQ